MKISIPVILLLMLLSKVHAQHADSVALLKIDFSAVKEKPKMTLLETVALDGYTVKKDTLVVSDQQNTYSINFKEPEFLTVSVQWSDRRESSVSFWSGPTMNIAIDAKYEVKIINVSAGEFASQIAGLKEQLNSFKTLSDSLVRKVSYVNRKTEDVEKEIEQIRDSIEILIDKDVYLKTIKSFPDEAIGLYALTRYADRPASNQRIKSNPDQISNMLKDMGPSAKKMPSAVILENNITLSKKMAIGKEFQNISLPDTSGKFISIRDIKAKYILVDFWASWCGPCRQQSPQLIKEFKKYNPRGFTIVSITRDSQVSKKNWLRAIRQDKIALWYQLSDFSNAAQKAYGIKYIPTNYLIDGDGTIIARNLTGDSLGGFLQQLFLGK